MGDNVHFFPGDVTPPDDAAAAAQLAVDKFGHLQALVNCAGIGVARRIYNARKGQLHSLEEFNRVININLGKKEHNRFFGGFSDTNSVSGLKNRFTCLISFYY